MTATMTQEQIRLIGLELLERELGPVGMVGFLQQCETGQGDYSSERFQLLPQADPGEITDEIRRRRGGA